MTTETTQYSLTCLVTGKSRPTTKAYLDSKSARLGKSTDDIVKNYISREAMVLLNAGKALTEVRETLGVSTDTVNHTAEQVRVAVIFNGKRAAVSA